MRRFRSWMPMVALLLVFGALQGLFLIEVAPDSRETGVLAEQQVSDNDDAWSWSGIVRDDGPLLERIPAPYVVLTILGGAGAIAAIWAALVRWTDISEAW